MDATESKRRNRGLSLICLSITIIIFIAGLWPFNFRPKNNVTWLNGKNGIHFDRRGIAYSKESVYGPKGAIRPGGPISIELVVLPEREPKYSLLRILTLCGEGNRQFFTIAQWRSYLVLRAAPQGNDLRNNFQEIGAIDVLPKNISRFVTVTSQNGTTKIYADGHLIKTRNDFFLLSEDPSATGRFVLGNSPSGNNSWMGDLLYLASYDRELPEDEVWQHFRDWSAKGTPTWAAGRTPTLLYAFDEGAGTIVRNHGEHHHDISIPATFHILQKRILQAPQRENYFSRSFISDVAVNILGFLPFGFFFTAWLRKDDGLPSKSLVFLVAALGGVISLTIELLQIYLPSRTSSLTDVICNVIGTILGIYMFRLIIEFLRVDNQPISPSSSR